MALTVYTSVFGDTDPLYDSPITSAVRFLCLTDNPRLKSRTWEMVYVGPVERPNRHSRVVKALSHQYTDTPWSLWMDCNFTLKVDPMSLIGLGEFVNFRHPDRDNLKAEAAEIVRVGKAKAATVAQQLQAYVQDGFIVDQPLPCGLCNNSVVLRQHTPAVCRLNELWHEQHQHYSLRDQLCLDYVMWKQGFTPQRFPGHYRGNPYFTYHKSRKPITDF